MEDNNLLNEIQKDFNNPKKKRAKKVKEEPKKSNVWFKIKLGLVLSVLMVIGVAYCAERYVDWRAEHQWQFPATWIGFVKEIERVTLRPIAEAKTQEVLTDDQVMEQYKLSPVLKSIRMLESTYGEKDGCKDEGKVNGFGYRQNSREFKCYDSLPDVVEKVNEWFEDRLSVNGNNLIEAVCYYNTGVPHQSTCGDYSENFMSVITNYF